MDVKYRLTKIASFYIKYVNHCKISTYETSVYFTEIYLKTNSDVSFHITTINSFRYK